MYFYKIMFEKNKKVGSLYYISKHFSKFFFLIFSICKDFFDKLYARIIKFSFSESINKNQEILSQILQLKSHKK